MMHQQFSLLLNKPLNLSRKSQINHSELFTVTLQLLSAVQSLPTEASLLINITLVLKCFFQLSLELNIYWLFP